MFTMEGEFYTCNYYNFCFVRLSSLLSRHSFGFKLTYSVMILCLLREMENNSIACKQMRAIDFHYFMSFSQSK